MTTETMREAVARAMYELNPIHAHPFELDGRTIAPAEKIVSWGAARDCYPDYCKPLWAAADAAIHTVLERLRERELVMRENGMVIHEVRGAPNDVWQAMLTAWAREVGLTDNYADN